MAIAAAIVLNAGAAETSKVLILPFDIHAGEDLGFLQQGIEDMLSSRLSREGALIPIINANARKELKNLSRADERKAASLGNEFGADYVAYGSLTIFGESISTDAKFYDIKQKKTIVTFYETGKGRGAVISHVNLFASEVHERLFGDKSSERRATAKTEKRRMHPNKLWTGDTETPASPVPEKIEKPAPSELEKAAPPKYKETAPLEPEKTIPLKLEKDVPAEPKAQRNEQIWRSRNFRTFVKGLSLGDVDGDGNIETVYADENKLCVFRQTGGTLQKMREIKSRYFHEIIAIDVADINGNGKSEIFVSNISSNKKLTSSIVLEWNGSGFEEIVSKSKWYYRVVNIPGRGPALFGQSRGIGKPFSPGIHELRWKGNEYVSVGRKALFRWANVFGMAFGDVLNNGSETITAFSAGDYLLLLDENGEKLWESGEEYGGSANYLEYPDDAAARIGGEREMSRIYIPQRILVADVDKDGKNEVVSVINKDTAARMLERFRLYKSGRFESLEWNGIGLVPEWKTNDISGYVSDYAIGDFDNDGRDELVFSVVAEIGSILGKSKSFIAALELGGP